MKNLFRVLMLAVCFVTFSCLGAFAVEAEDVKVTSDKMTYSADGQTVIFSDNVFVKHPQADLWADQVTVFLQSNGETTNAPATPGVNPGKVREIIAEGNVRIKMDQDRSGSCQKAVYNLEQELLTMTGSPELSEGKNTISGTVIKFWIKENRSEVLGSQDRPVEAIFSSPEKEAKQ